MGFEQENINLDILKRKGKYRAQVFQKFQLSKANTRQTQADRSIEPQLSNVKHIITICSFWLIKQVDRSIEPLACILGRGCDSSQHQRTSRINSIQSTAIAEIHKRIKT